MQWWGQKGILVNWECMVQKLVREYAVGQGKSASDGTLWRLFVFKFQYFSDWF